MIDSRTIIILLIPSLLFMIVVTDHVYTIVHERGELEFYNDSVVEPNVVFSFQKINKTDFSLNTSFTLTRDLVDKKLMIKFLVDKLFGGEYKRTGTSLTVNICKFYERNTFGARDMLTKNCNFKLCAMTKGFYYLYNFIPDPKLFPKFIPFGSYKMIIEVAHQDGSLLMRVFWYARVEKLIKY